MTPEKIAEAAIAKLNKRITDEIFLTIQKDRELMQDYLRAVEQTGLDAVNQTIGRCVKMKYGLNNSDEREDCPVSTLIQSHQKFD